MREVSVRELKDGLSEYLRIVERGERVVVTRSGRAVAALVPMADVVVADGGRILADLAARGAVRLPLADARFCGERLDLAVSASALVLEDRR